MPSGDKPERNFVRFLLTGAGFVYFGCSLIYNELILVSLFQPEPELVVVSFVLNDVTEKFRLIKFGGADRGAQLMHAISPFHLWLIENCSIAYFAGKLVARSILGPNIQRGPRGGRFLMSKC